MFKKIVQTLTVAIAYFISFTAEAIEPTPQQLTLFLPTNMPWKMGPSLLPAGTSVALLEGDISKPGPFTIRIKIPAGYKLPPIWNPNELRITLISGGLNLGFGNKFDQTSGKSIPAGSFFIIAPMRCTMRGRQKKPFFKSMEMDLGISITTTQKMIPESLSNIKIRREILGGNRRLASSTSLHNGPLRLIILRASHLLRFSLP